MPDPPAAAPNDWTIGKLLTWTRSHFESSGVDEPRLSAEILLAHALGCRRIDLYARFEQAPTEPQRATFRELVRKAAEHQPIAYLVGHKEFYSLDFLVTPDVLIPRPETELLVEQALAWCATHPQDRYDLLDVGTGSGCIAVAICKRQASVHAVATDVSDAALAVAAENARRHELAERIRTMRADLFNLPPDVVPPGKFNLIVSNPPYVSETDRDSLPENVRKYEPAAALFAGADGLDVFRRIATDVTRYLRLGGLLLVEVGMGQAKSVDEIFAAHGLKSQARFKDVNGIERALAFTLPA
ncbi:MAG TPA: peptide chain release factor N(5)-glutamine methyltransferase [Phycisphaerae bacterium]|nr:peptide chain release factor N(5)-glutamine methyltransferase [Phycisphaerae bacterium]